MDCTSRYTWIVCLLSTYCWMASAELPDPGQVTRLLEEAANVHQTTTRIFQQTHETPPPRETLEQTHTTLESIVTRLREIQFIFSLHVFQEGTPLGRVSSAVNKMITKMLCLLQRLNDRMDGLEQTVCQPERRLTGRKGRPRLIIRQDSLESLIALNFSWKTIARFYGVAVCTLYRRRQELNLPPKYSSVSDDELDDIVRQLKSRTPESLGTGMALGHLAARGFQLANGRRRVADSLRRIDPDMTKARWNTTIKRRLYKVRGPGSLYHLDGNHKLIRWKVVIHGCIDGYSRVITMLKASDNNRAATVLDNFQESLQTWPLPSRLRTDLGGENILVGRLMTERRGENRGSWITGPSVHNQRIERLWRDLRVSCTQFFIDLFYDMEATGLLDVESPVDIFVLHYIFLPRLNTALAEFQQAWHNHGLRTEGSQTPLRLWTSGMLRARATSYTEDYEQRDWSQYGIDFIPGVVEEEGGDERNDVSLTRYIGLPQGQFLTLCTRLDAAIAQMAPDSDPQQLYTHCRDITSEFTN